MKCPECGHEERPGAYECSRCPCIFPEERTRSPGDFAGVRLSSPLIQFAVAVIGLGLVVLAAFVFQREQREIEAQEKAARMSSKFNPDRLDASLKALEDPINNMGNSLRKLTEKITELESGPTAEEIMLEKFYVKDPARSEHEKEDVLKESGASSPSQESPEERDPETTPPEEGE